MNNIIHGDCLEVMKKIPDGIIDMILCDLPYQITSCDWDQMIPLDILWEQYTRLIKDSGAIVLTAAQPFTSELILSNKKMFKYEWIWVKSGATGFLNAKLRPLKKHETVLVFSKSKGIYNPQFTDGTPYKVKSGRTNGKSVTKDEKITRGGHVTESDGKRYPVSVIQFNSETGLHPTQKPVELGRYLVKTYTNEGDLVLDNCAGSGSFCVAAMLENRNFIGIEKEEKYVEIARQRIKETLEVLSNKSSSEELDK